MAKCNIQPNVTNAEIKALSYTHKANSKLIIKKADKGGGIAVMDTEAYISQINEMLTDINTYRSCTDNDTDTVTLNA